MREERRGEVNRGEERRGLQCDIPLIRIDAKYREAREVYKDILSFAVVYIFMQPK